MIWVVATQIFLLFSPRTLGKMIQIDYDYIIFFQWVGSTTNYMIGYVAMTNLAYNNMMYRKIMITSSPRGPNPRHMKPKNIPQRQFSKVVSTHLWNTPLNLYEKAKEGFLS